MKGNTKTNKLKKECGITLIALVITIILLLILAGVTISIVVKSGILDKSEGAIDKYKKQEIRELIQVDIADKQMDNRGDITSVDLKNILEKYGTIEYDEDETTILGIEKTYDGGYKIPLKDIWDGKVVEIKSNVANPPNTEGFNVNNTYYVSWNVKSAPYQINEVKMSSVGKAPSDWYDYSEDVKHWANIKTTGGNNNCYWVWIPRYAYKITYYTDNYYTEKSDVKTRHTKIDVVFLNETTNNDMKGKDVTSSSYVDSKGNIGAYIVHPAFWWDEDNNGIETNGEQLTGIWVAKYEASSNSDKIVENPTTDEQIRIDSGSALDTDLKVRVIPNVRSWGNISVGSMFQVCKNMIDDNNSLEDTSKVDSHMMKNVEWGAIAYLSLSQYGKEDQIWNNSYYFDGAITGLCGLYATDKTSDLQETFKYNTEKGVNASTTGNVYGVYDMVRWF